MYLHNDEALFEEVLLGAARAFAISEEFAAKDYWAMMMGLDFVVFSAPW